MEDFQIILLPGGEESQLISTFSSNPTDHTTRIKSKQEIQFKHLSPHRNFMSSLLYQQIKHFKNLELCCNWQFHIQHQCTLIRKGFNYSTNVNIYLDIKTNVKLFFSIRTM